jgi:hypothetical protein
MNVVNNLYLFAILELKAESPIPQVIMVKKVTGAEIQGL